MSSSKAILSSGGSSIAEQPEISEAIKGSAASPECKFWYCCREEDMFHGKENSEYRARSHGYICPFCSHQQCRHCKVPRELLQFWLCCNNAPSHAYEIDTKSDYTTDKLSRGGWPANQDEYTWCRLCGHERCMDCQYYRIPVIIGRKILGGVKFKSLFKYARPITVKGQDDEHEVTLLNSWVKAMEYQKSRQKKQEQQKPKERPKSEVETILENIDAINKQVRNVGTLLENVHGWVKQARNATSAARDVESTPDLVSDSSLLPTPDDMELDTMQLGDDTVMTEDMTENNATEDNTLGKRRRQSDGRINISPKTRLHTSKRKR